MPVIIEAPAKEGQREFGCRYRAIKNPPENFPLAGCRMHAAKNK
jgi:hypothetical protein